MASGNAKRSLKKELSMIKRGCGMIRKLSPGLLELSLLSSLFSAVIPYIAIYMSALIVDELVGNRDFKLLIGYVAVAAGGTLLLTLISEVITRKINVMNAMFEAKFDYFLNNKKLSLDFMKLEDPKYTELRDKISGTTYMTGGGIASIVKHMTSIADSSLSVVIAVLLLQNATVKNAASAAGAGGMVNSGWFFGFLMVVIIGCTALTVRNSKIESMKEFKAIQNCGTNRYLGYYHFSYMKDDQAGKDIRIFDQRKLIIDEVLSKGRLPWFKILDGRFSLCQKYFGANTAITAFLGGFAYAFVGLKALSGSISLGSVTKSYASIVRLVLSVGNLSLSLTKLKSNNNYLELLYEFMDIPSELHEGKEIPAKGDAGWEIEFHNVSFRYPSCETYAVKNLSLKISSNSRTAIVGMNGSGKTTVIKLLCRFYKPDVGYITLNGRDIACYDYEAYLKLFSVVFQDFRLLAFPVGQNVAASAEYEEEKVWAALNTSGISERVKEYALALEQPLYKHVDENGVDLSGGEEQKVAIARAVYKDAPFVVLDEPTASLDPVAEFQIYSKFNEIIGDKAAVFISHRLSSCRFCNTIAVFHHGELIEQGTHEQLLQKESGKYVELWNAQAQYYA